MTHLQRTNSENRINHELLDIIANHKNQPILKLIPITIIKKKKSSSCFCFCQSSIDEDVSCPICFESIPNQNIFITSCNHTFCISCITEYIKYQKNSPSLKHLTCPLCRQEINEFKINNKKHIRILQLATLNSINRK
jgi:hypothetical protein